MQLGNPCNEVTPSMITNLGIVRCFNGFSFRHSEDTVSMNDAPKHPLLGCLLLSSLLFSSLLFVNLISQFK